MPSHSYKRLAEILEAASFSLNHPEPLSESISREHEEAWLEEDQTYKERLDSICRRWARDQIEFPDLPPREEYFLWIRFFAASAFLYQLDMPEGKEMIPYPKVSEQEMFEWLLVDWWQHTGREASLYSYNFTFKNK
ncbi:hypothetical protein [Pelagicoccus sp. SDUM812003]|uniref:hypothetical protein n=1 Tax=Pelagicoccus sp. SDUM812003 TaxID=3041267 RepID=UPI00280E1DAB|nr:hypothetical protein [Pelagicoccus sp. SDUM812003]MDQ8205732.1 hypothetical protein [Pelagicoccus sp. SDUM812003]